MAGAGVGSFQVSILDLVNNMKNITRTKADISTRHAINRFKLLLTFALLPIGVYGIKHENRVFLKF